MIVLAVHTALGVALTLLGPMLSVAKSQWTSSVALSWITTIPIHPSEFILGSRHLFTVTRFSPFLMNDIYNVVIVNFPVT